MRDIEQRSNKGIWKNKQNKTQTLSSKREREREREREEGGGEEIERQIQKKL